MQISPIGTIRTPFAEKFTIPRQSQVVSAALGVLKLQDIYRHSDSLDGLRAHSHYWLIWGFHLHEYKKKTLKVRPPRLGGNQQVGVFATRSPFRPNNLGLSVVKLESINSADFSLTFSGVDMLSGSPVYDLKPYIPYADSRPDATSEWAGRAPEKTFLVTFLPKVKQALVDYDQATHRGLLNLLTVLLAYDPRPAYKQGKTDDKIYATQLYDQEIVWQIDDKDETVTVIAVTVKKQ